MAVNDLITFRKGPASQWTSVNPVLASGEPGYDLTNSILKIGDGVSNWVSLSGIGSTSVGGGVDLLLRSLFVPAAPTNVTASAATASAIISWTAPTVLAQTPITDYIVQFSSNSGSTWTTFADGTSAATTATVTGLVNGTAYVFRVMAVNILGQSAWSATSSAVTPAAGDSLFSTVVLLIHANGAGSSFIDTSSSPKTITSSGATQSTAQSKFGGSSAYFDGNAMLTVPYSSAFDLSTGDWTVEAWWRPDGSAGTDPNIISITPIGSTYAQVRITAYNNGQFRLLCASGGGWVSTTLGGSWSSGNWYHLAAVRSGSQFYLFVNGAQAINYSFSSSLSSGTMATTIGAVDVNGSGRVIGYIDDIRVSKGVARYTSGFSVPTVAFPDGP